MTTATRLREEGKIEAKLETARRMLEKGSDVSFIAEVTGLSQAEIEALHNKNG
ncbi:MAG TPA: hypothetical protein PK297_14760 [Spirochaetota bacterium]|nr:hypothetical protein [Spirochaetota bacterium]